MASHADGNRDASGLKHELRRWQIFFIVLTAVIGGGVFSSNGEALEIAGPAGFLTAVIVFGLVSIAVLDGVSELTQLFPVMNALPEYTNAFVDRDLSWIVGLAYWYTFASTFAVQNLAAANLSRYWGVSQLWQTLAFYVFAPILVLGVNMFGVATFGWIESISGVLKLGLAFGTAVALYVAAGVMKLGNNGPINDGFQANTDYIENHPKAACYAIPLVAFSYLGQEIFVVTAFEAKRARDLRLPSQILPYVVLGLYLLISIGEALNVRWTDSHLPKIYGGIGPVREKPTNPSTSSMVILALFRAGYKDLAGFLNGCLIFSVLSASNTSLYVASRTLYGMASKIPDTNVVGRNLQWLKIVPFRNGVPAWSLVISALAFCWLPFLQLKKGYPVQDLQTILSVSASISLVLVWMVLCIGFIRYCNWLALCRADVPLVLSDYHRNSKTHKAYTALGFAQPFMAWLGLIGCAVVLAFASATWWDTPASFTKVAVAYAAPMVLLPIWLLLKLSWYLRGHGWGFVSINNNVTELADLFSKLTHAKPADLNLAAEKQQGGAVEEAQGYQFDPYAHPGGAEYAHTGEAEYTTIPQHGRNLSDHGVQGVSPVHEYPHMQEYPPTANYYPLQQHAPQQQPFTRGAAVPEDHSRTELLDEDTYYTPAHQPHMPHVGGRYPD